MRRALPMTKPWVALLYAAGALVCASASAQTQPPTAAPATKAAPAAPSSTPAAPGQAAPGQAAPAQPAEAPPAPPPEAKAATPAVEELLKQVANLATAIEAAEKNLEQSPGSQRDLATLRTSIEKIGSGAKEAAATLKKPLDEVRSQIAKLGAPPAAGEPPEATDVAAERERLNGLAAQIDGAIKKASLLEERARQLISRVQHVRQGIFTRFLFRQTDAPLQWRVWEQAGSQLHLARRQSGFILSNWWSTAKLNGLGLMLVLGAALLAFVGLHVITRRLMRAHLDAAGPSTPSLPERAANAAWVAPALALPPAAALVILYIGLDELGLLYWQVERFARGALFPLFVAIGIMALARALLQPRRSRWRVLDIDDAAARTVSFAVQAIAVVFAIDYLARELVAILSLSLSTSIVTAFIASLLYAALLLLIARTPFTSAASAPGVSVDRWRPYRVKLPLIALAVVLVAASALGYVALGRFIVTQILTTGAGVLIIALLHIAIRAIVPAQSGQPNAMSAIIEQRFNLDEFGRAQVARVQRVLLNVALFTVGVPLLLLSWGLTGAEIASWMRAALFGFEVAGVRISLARILMALALFVALLAATRFVQRWLAANALAQGRMEAGLANSIYTGAGYVGFAVAALTAISYAGFDITSLAIVAGALSVGLGFGLQSIVNNFVSGLILLVERPIKVGDRVTVDGQEGFVRRISVRSTEIETFDRASLIVPNSDFITKTVTNWTHRNALGRALVKVSVAYDADPEQVIEILLKVAGECPLIQKHPPPWAGLDNFGADGLDFVVLGVVADVNKVPDARADLRIRILHAFRAAKVEVPYPQHDVHLRDMEGLQRLLARIADQQADSRARAGDEPPTRPPDND